jgi:hypothetical protein
LDSYAFSGVEYHAPVRAELHVSEEELARLAHTFRLVESPDIDGAGLPPEFNLQVREGQLVGVAPEGCVSLVALAPTRFAIPENSGLILEFNLDEDRVESLTLRAGPLTATYRPLPAAETDGTSHLFQGVRAEIERQVREGTDRPLFTSEIPLSTAVLGRTAAGIAM